MPTRLPEVPLDKDHEYIYTAKGRVTETGVLANATGLTGLTACFATVDADLSSKIDGTQVSLVARSGKLYEYFGILDRVSLNTALESLHLWQNVFEIVARDGHVESSEPVKIVLTRRPG